MKIVSFIRCVGYDRIWTIIVTAEIQAGRFLVFCFILMTIRCNKGIHLSLFGSALRIRSQDMSAVASYLNSDTIMLKGYSMRNRIEAHGYLLCILATEFDRAGRPIGSRCDAKTS